MQRRIIDQRNREKFQVDDAYLNGMSKKVGWQGTLVYFCLCRHANISQESFPSIKLMQEKLGIGFNTVRRGIQALEKFNVISVQREKDKSGKWLNNTYVLIDKSEWLNYTPHSPVENVDIQKPQPCGDKTTALSEQNHSPVGSNKETHIRTHIEGNTFETFWTTYPIRKGKKAAQRAWQNSHDKPPIEEIVKAIELQKKSREWKEGFIPHPATWLNQGRWADEIEASVEEKKKEQRAEPVLDERGNIVSYRLVDK